MKKRKSFRLSACFLLIALILQLTPGKACAVTQEEIDELRKQRLAIAEEHEEKQAIVDELEEEKAGVLARKEAMDQRNVLTRQEIQNIKQEIALYDQMIAEEAITLEQARETESRQLDRYRSRVRAMEENGELGYLGLILQISDLSELLVALDDAGDIMKSDVELYDAYIDARQHTEAVKAQYEEKKTELEGIQEELRIRQAALEAEIDEASQLIRDLEEDIDKRNEELHELLLAEIATAERIDQLVAEQERQRREEEERRRREEEARRQQETPSVPAPSDDDGGDGGGSGEEGDGSGGGSVVGTGSWAWPCPSCTYVTSRAGNRYHPIFDEYRYHSGIDIGAGYGASVTASDSGTVILADVNGGYGNCIMIDHGNGYYTLYGHLSGYAVSEGQSVSQGQTIGYVGDTGWATGPHLHFEIRLGGTCLDPEEAGGFYGLSYAPDAGD